MRSKLPLSLLILGLISPTMAQDRVVQQPVVRQMRVGTSVSVPDRGRAFLGGVSTGATGTKRFGGPLWSGTNSGREFANSSQTVSVYIHDFEAMDEALLNEALLNAAPSSPTRRAEKQLSPRAAHAWRTLESRHARK